MYLDRLDEAAEALQRAADRKVAGPEFTAGIFTSRSSEGTTQPWNGSSRGPEVTSPSPTLTHFKSLALARSGQLQLAGSLARRAIELTQNARQRERAALFQAAPAVWHAFMGNVAEARRAAAMALDMSTGRDVSYAAAFALALTGELSRSQALLKDLEARFPQDTTVNISYLPALRGLIALQQGKPGGSTHRSSSPLCRTNSRCPARHSSPASEASIRRTCAARRIWPQKGRRTRPSNSGRSSAAAVLSWKIPSTRSRACNWPERSSPAETPQRARAAYQDFLTLWKQADPDVPLLKQAQAEAAKLQ